MELKITTAVNGNYREVYARFDQKLFQKLNPPFPPVKLTRFDGSRKGDQVALQLNFILFKQDWVSLITHDEISGDQAHFIDEGIRLPFFLKFWRHRHFILNKSTNKSAIVDHITYRTWNLVTDILFLPVLYLQFLYRKPVYKKYFNLSRS